MRKMSRELQKDAADVPSFPSIAMGPDDEDGGKGEGDGEGDGEEKE